MGVTPESREHVEQLVGEWNALIEGTNSASENAPQAKH
jgi:hypothetical protein